MAAHLSSLQQAMVARALFGAVATGKQEEPKIVSPSMLSAAPVVVPKISEETAGVPQENNSSLLAQALLKATPRRPRGEKKPIPEEQKDLKYWERRKRNNLAAKKSRDQRKVREDSIAIRAGMLEKENAILRAQVSTLRDEKTSLRTLLRRRRRSRANNK